MAPLDDLVELIRSAPPGDFLDRVKELVNDYKPEEIVEILRVEALDVRPRERIGKIKGISRAVNPFWRSTPKPESGFQAALLQEPLVPDVLTYKGIPVLTDPENVKNLMWAGNLVARQKPLPVSVSLQLVVDRVKVYCPNHDKVCEVTFNPISQDFTWACPANPCSFSLTWRPETPTNPIEMVAVSIARLRAMIFENPELQGTIPVCPLCRYPMKPGSLDKNTWYCQLCAFTISDDALAAYRGGQRRRAKLEIFDWENALELIEDTTPKSRSRPHHSERAIRFDKDE